MKDDIATRYVEAFRDHYLKEIRRVRPHWGNVNHQAFVRCMYYLLNSAFLPDSLKVPEETVPESILLNTKQPATYTKATEAATYLLSDSGPFLGQILRQQQLRDGGMLGGRYDIRPV